MKHILGGVAIGVSAMFAGVVIDRNILWEPPKVSPRPQLYVTKVDLLPAVHTLSCSKESLQQALELLRICRARKRMEEVR